MLRGSGVVYRCLGWFDDAIEHLDQAVTLGRDLGEADVETAALNDLGDALHAAERSDEATQSYQDALVLARRPVIAMNKRGRMSGWPRC